MPGYLRFRRTARIMPGVRLNFSKRGVSTSFGPRGLHYTVGHGRRRTTVGVPGTGLSYTTYSSTHARQAQRPSARSRSTPRPRRAPGPSAPPAAAPPSPGIRLGDLTPGQKIAWGLGLTLLVVTSPIGLWLLITGLWQLHLPEWRIRSYVRQASREPANAAALLGAAAAIDPHNPEVLGPLAELRSAQGDNAAALPLYREYCEKVPSDWLARGHLALSALRCNQVDEAITHLVAIQRAAPVTGDSMASIVAHLAYTYLCKDDPQQALALVDGGGSTTARAGPGGEQCLFYRAVCQYMLGRTAGAVKSLDQLYAIDPAYPGLQAAKDAMAAGVYELLLPDGTALVPVTPGHVTRSTTKVQRTAPRSPHCRDCQAPLAAGVVSCPYCHAAVPGTAGAGEVPPPPPPPPAP